MILKRNTIEKAIQDSINTKKAILEDQSMINQIEIVAFDIYEALKNGKKVVLAGNGGSASDSLHIAGELVGRFQKERNAWPAISLNANIASLTAIANDYGYDEVFSRQVEAFVQDGDVFLGFTTSGNSENIINAVEKVKEKKAISVALTGKDGGKIKDIADICLIVPNDNTARIQESHIMIGHIICGIVEELMVGELSE